MVPVMVIESRSSAGETTATAVLSRESTNVVVDAWSPEVCNNLSWTGYPYDGSYSSTTDSDGDGISDYEVFDLTTNSIVHCHVTNGVLPQLVASNGEYGVRLQYKVSRHWRSNMYRFCDTNGNVVVRNHDAAARRIYGDTLLVRLTVPLPASVVPAKLFPADYAEYLGDGKYLPSVCVNEKQQVVVGELEDLDTSVSGFQHYGKVSSTNIVTGAREGIRGAISIGQSSSPVFLLVDKTPVLLLIKHLGYPDVLQWNPTWGPSLPHFIDVIQRTIDSWEGEGACRLDVIDLTAFERLTR